jgi:excisionase family DNA binding protein
MSVPLEPFDPLECLPPDRVAKLLGVSKSQVYTLARRGQIPHQRAGGSVLFPRLALERWLARASEVADDAPRGRVDSLASGRGARRSARR